MPNNNFDTKERILIKAVYRNRIAGIEGGINYYKHGDTRWFDEQVRGNKADEIYRLEEKKKDVLEDIRIFEKTGIIVDLANVTDARRFLDDLNELVRTNIGKELFENEFEGEEYYAKYLELYDKVEKMAEVKHPEGVFEAGGSVTGENDYITARNWWSNTLSTNEQNSLLKQHSEILSWPHQRSRIYKSGDNNITQMWKKSGSPTHSEWLKETYGEGDLTDPQLSTKIFESARFKNDSAGRKADFESSEFEKGGNISSENQSKIDKLQKVVDSKMVPDSVKEKAKAEIEKLKAEEPGSNLISSLIENKKLVRLITYSGKRIFQRIQLNKDNETYTRYHCASKAATSCVKINEHLTLDEVKSIFEQEKTAKSPEKPTPEKTDYSFLVGQFLTNNNDVVNEIREVKVDPIILGYVSLRTSPDDGIQWWENFSEEDLKKMISGKKVKGASISNEKPTPSTSDTTADQGKLNKYLYEFLIKNGIDAKKMSKKDAELIFAQIIVEAFSQINAHNQMKKFVLLMDGKTNFEESQYAGKYYRPDEKIKEIGEEIGLSEKYDFDPDILYKAFDFVLKMNGLHNVAKKLDTAFHSNELIPTEKPTPKYKKGDYVLVQFSGIDHYGKIENYTSGMPFESHNGYKVSGIGDVLKEDQITKKVTEAEYLKQTKKPVSKKDTAKEPHQRHNLGTKTVSELYDYISRRNIDHIRFIIDGKKFTVGHNDIIDGIYIKKTATGEEIKQGFKRGGNIASEHVYISNRYITAAVVKVDGKLKQFKSRDVLDGIYVKKEFFKGDIPKTGPVKVSRTQFEDEDFEFEKGGKLC